MKVRQVGVVARFVCGMAMGVSVAVRADPVMVQGPYTAASYAPEGLILQYDGIENAGRGLSDASGEMRIWKNLAPSGSDYDLTLPDFVTFQDRSFLSSPVSGCPGTTAIDNSKNGKCPEFLSLPGVVDDASAVTTVEIVMQRGDWVYTDNCNNLQFVLETPSGSYGYRLNEDHGFFFTGPKNETQNEITALVPTTKNATTPYSFAGIFGLGAKAFWIGGMHLTDSGWGSSYFTLERGTKYVFFSNVRAAIRVYAIRFYNRRLTDSEIAVHQALDAFRFFGTPLPTELTFDLPEIGPQVWNGVDDVCPAVAVSNVAARVRLTPGVDYTVSYKNNARPGTATVTVRGKGAYAGISRTRSYEIRLGLTGGISPDGDGRLVASLEVPAAADVSRRIFAAFDSCDRGPETNGWAQVVALGELAPGATSVKGLPLPDLAGLEHVAAVRLFVETPVSSRSYVTEGLALQLDGIDNACHDGVRCHEESPTAWSDLTGNGQNIAFPRLTDVESTSVVSHADPAKGANDIPSLALVEGIDVPAGWQLPRQLTAETVTRFEGWKYTDNPGNLQSVLITPLGYMAYRNMNPTPSGYGIAFSMVSDAVWSTQYNTYNNPSASVDDIHTFSARLETDAPSYAMDGEVTGTFSATWIGKGEVERSFRFFSNLRADIRVYSIRLYGHKLMNDELARNARVDEARFRLGNGMLLAATEPVACADMIKAKVRSRSHVPTITVRYPAADYGRTLYVAWGATDGGERTNGWENVARLAAIPVGSDCLRDVVLPEAATRSEVGRLFLADEYDSASYVTAGLVLQYDGLDNAVSEGGRRHDPQTTVWAELTGRGPDVTLPSYVSVEANALYSYAVKDKVAPGVSVPAITKETPMVTVETVAQRGIWRLLDDKGNLQYAFEVPHGAVGYRSDGFFAQYPKNATQTDLSNLYSTGLSPTDLHTLAGTFDRNVDENAVWIDGMRHLIERNATWVEGFLDECRIFYNLRADIRIHAIRLYDRKLEPWELVRNAQIDAVRFGGAEPRFVSSEPVDLRLSGLIIFLR